MHVQGGRLILFVFILLFCRCTAAGQKADNAPQPQVAGTWKKQVTRDIDMKPEEDTVLHHLRDQNGDISLFEMLVNAVKSGKLTAYNNIGPFFTNTLSVAALNDAMSPKTDTEVITDPVTGNSMTTVVTRDFQYSNIHKYRILEEWGYDPVAGKTEIQVTGIAPLMDVYTGSYSGTKSVFWLHYADARGILATYEERHPDNTLASHIWKDYFRSDIKPVVQQGK